MDCIYILYIDFSFIMLEDAEEGLQWMFVTSLHCAGHIYYLWWWIMTCRGQATSEYNFWVNSWQNKAREDKQKQTATQLLWINIDSGQSFENLID